MAKKRGKRGGGGKRQRAQQRAQYDELDKYPVMPPHAFARVVRDKQTLNIIYQIIEPPMTKKEEQYRDEILDIFIRSLTANIEEIDADPSDAPEGATTSTVKVYGLKTKYKNKFKFYEWMWNGGI